MILQGDEAQVEACLSPFGDSANLTQDRCTVCAKRTIGSEIVLNAPDGSPRRVGHVESHFGPFGDNVSVGAIQVHCLRRTYHWLILDEWVMWNLISVRLETMLVSVQYRCIVCAEHTIGSEIVLDAPDDTPR
jgi:hypothetical protein